MISRATLSAALAAALLALPAHASFLSGDALDTMADVVSWVALIVAPVTVIILFWLVHIMPEKIAEKKKHPQAKAIQVLCLLSLAFGGMLWPLAWLWAYSKPVLYKMAYGTDTVEHEPAEQDKAAAAPSEVESLRSQVAALEARLASQTTKQAASGPWN